MENYKKSKISKNMIEYSYQKKIEDSYLYYVEHHPKKESKKLQKNDIEKIYNEKIMYENFYDNIFEDTEEVIEKKIKSVMKEKEKLEQKDDYYGETYEYHEGKNYDEDDGDDYKDLIEKTRYIANQFKKTNNIEDIINKKTNEYLKNSKKNEVTSIEEPFEKKKFLEASLFMKIGHLVGLSLRNQYYKNLDEKVKKALKENEIYRVLEAQKNGYYLGKKLNKLTFETLYKELTTNPLKLIEELVTRDVMLSFDNLSLILLSNDGPNLITGTNLENYPKAKELYQNLLNKENFIYANKNLWLKTLSDKDIFLQENNPLFYHEKMLKVCEKSELIGVQKALEKFLQQEDVLKSISKNKLIDKMLLKINLQLGNSMELEHIVLDLPEIAQNLYKSIKEIKFSENDIKILESYHNYEYEIVDKRMPEAIMKYVSVESKYRNTLKNTDGKTAENLLIETLENILITKKDLNLAINEAKLSDLSVTRRYTDSIRGDIGRPSLVTLKTLKQLKESGELNDLVNETIFESKKDSFQELNEFEKNSDDVKLSENIAKHGRKI